MKIADRKSPATLPAIRDPPGVSHPMHKALAFLAVALLPLLGAPADTPKLLRPFNVPVNGDGDEDEPHVAGDGRTLYFTAPTGGKDEVRYARRRSAVQPWPAR